MNDIFFFEIRARAAPAPGRGPGPQAGADYDSPAAVSETPGPEQALSSPGCRQWQGAPTVTGSHQTEPVTASETPSLAPAGAQAAVAAVAAAPKDSDVT